MIFLRGRGLLFVKPKKTAGTSVEVALSCNATPEDIVTPLIEEDERIRWELGGQFPVNWASKASDERDYRARFEQYLRDGRVPRRFFGLRPGRLWRRRGARFFNHMTPAEVLGRAGPGPVADAFMVTMVRHPYEQVVSYAFHQHDLHGKPFVDCLAHAVGRPPLNDAYLFGPKTPDFVIRYERLKDDLAALEERFALTLVAKLPQTKHTARADRRPAADWLSDAQKAEIRARHARTFQSYGYRP